MDYYETSQGARVRVLLTEEELQFPAIDDLCNKFLQWLQISKETSGRKTRLANRKADQIYDEIMSFKVPPIQLRQLPSPKHVNYSSDSADTSVVDTSSVESRPILKSLRPRSRTPTNTKPAVPSTPTHQRLRAHMKQPNSTNSSCVLGTALAQGHPKVSVTKIKQLLKFTDSAQKKRDEEKERQARLILERKAKEERAEAQKKQLLEERAENAKLNREKRLNHAAELRKAREAAKVQEKLKEQQIRKAQAAEEKAPPAPRHNHNTQQQHHHNQQQQQPPTNTQPPPANDPQPTPTANNQPPAPVQKLNETFKKPTEEINNINISIQDETNEEITKEYVPKAANWTRAPHLREALVKQFSKSDRERQQEVSNIFKPIPWPVELEKIFGSSKAVNMRYLCRTSSAVWSPPCRAIKRTSSMVDSNS